MESPPTDVTSRTRVPSRRRRAKTERLVRLQPTSRTGQRHRNKTMDHIQAIQEMIDTNKDEMPVYVATRVMEECQKLYESLCDQNSGEGDVDDAETDEAATMFRRVYAAGGLQGEALEQKVRERLQG